MGGLSIILLTLTLFLIVLMAAPATTTRTTPGGVKLKDGYRSLIGFALDPDVSFWEKTLKPPGIDNGDPIDQTTMWNDAWITKAEQALNEVTDGSLKCAYDPNVYNNIITNLMSKNGSITIRYRDGSTLDFYGYLKSFEPDEMVRGTQPEATVTFVATNFDPVNKVEQGPVLTSVSGT